jgi:hypothetical protein
MKITSKPAGIYLAGLLIAMAVIIVIQHQVLSRVRQENRSLQEQVNGLSAQLEQLTAEKERLSKSAAAQQANASALLPQEPSGEMLRLRGEVGRLRRLERDTDQSLHDQMQAAQGKVANAEAELARLTKLRAENLVSIAEIDQASFDLELLKAQAKGDAAGVSRIRLQQAEKELARAAELRNESLISQTEYDEAIRKVASVKAGTDR